MHEVSGLVGCDAGLLGERFRIFLKPEGHGFIPDDVIGIFH